MPLKLVEVLLLLPLLHPQKILVKLLNGLETIIVMMTITMKNVAGMEETVVEKMLTQNIALPVNVWIQMEEDLHQPQLQLSLQLQVPLQMHVVLPIGLVTIIVMMTITMRNVVGMVETVVEKILTYNIALLVNV